MNGADASSSFSNGWSKERSTTPSIVCDQVPSRRKVFMVLNDEIDFLLLRKGFPGII
jgi:hypothetical protein